MKNKKLDPVEQEQHLTEVRNAIVDTLIGSSFRLSATGTIFTIGQDCTPAWNDILFCLNRMYTCNYVQEFKLLPFNVEPEVLVSGLSKDVVAWVVPILIQNVDRKVLAGQIDILAPNNHTLVRLMDVLGWYWHKMLHGPKPVTSSLIKMQRPTKVVQDAALSCPLCFHQFIPAPSYKRQSDKVFAFSSWLPTHLVQYHRFHKMTHTKVSKCQCGVCTGTIKRHTTRKDGTK